MSFKRIKALKSEKHISSPSLDFYATSSNSLKDLNYVGNINEKITNLQKNLEETQINFLGEKQQKLEKLSEIQTLFEKNKRINKNLIQATLKIKKTDEKNKELENEVKTCKKFLEEIGFDYEKNEPLIYKIELIEKQMDEKNNKIKEMNEELNQKKMEISEKNKGIEELQNLQIDNGILKLELKKKEKCIKSLAEEIMQLKTVFYSHELEKEKKFKLSEERIENLERENRDLISKYEGLNIQFTSKKDLTESLTKSLILAEIKLDELHRIKTASSELETELIKRKKEILELNKTIIDLNKKLKPFLIKKNETIQNLLCRLCYDPIENAITVIPCGHSYCNKCEIGYNSKKCKTCNCSIEAIYRNELMNEMKKWFVGLTNEINHF